MDGDHRYVGVGDGDYSRVGNKGRLTPRSAKASLKERLVETELTRLFERVRPNPARDPFTVNLAIGIFVAVLELEQVLRDDHIAFHADHFGNLRGAA